MASSPPGGPWDRNRADGGANPSGRTNQFAIKSFRLRAEHIVEADADELGDAPQQLDLLVHLTTWLSFGLLHNGITLTLAVISFFPSK
jgi:hypothetical protein